MMSTVFSDQNSVLSCMNNLCSFETEDVFINNLLQDKPELPNVICGCCDEGTAATSRCTDCNEYLCDSCVRAHLRVRLTKDHCILHITGSPIQLSPFSSKASSSSPNGNLNSYCEQHVSEPIRFYCDSCSAVICSECTSGIHRGHTLLYLHDAFENARAANCKLLSDSKSTAQSVREGLNMTQKMIDNVNSRANSVSRDIRLIMGKLQAALKEREIELLAKIENIRKRKKHVLLKQAEGLQMTLNQFSCVVDHLSEVIEVGSPMDQLNTKVQIFQDIKNLTRTAVKLNLTPLEDDRINLQLPDVNLLKAMANFGDIECSTSYFGTIGQQPFPMNGFHAPRSRISSLTLPAKSTHEDLSCSNKDLFMSANNFLSSSENSILSPDLDDRLDSSYLPYPSFNPDYPANSQICLMQSRLPVSNMYPVCVCTSRKFSNSACPATLTFGKEGDGDGELCRPWGICCDLEGNIIVADRSNNRIQIFKSDGTFLHKFGKHGSEPGQFDRPAGVAVSPLGDIVVADKDNHRIQIFTHDGKFKFTFGEKGSKTGQFNYPWDVDVSSDGRIVVSDTRNHRIQVFSSDGSFLNRYGFESSSSMWKHFDSPRGVCFAPNSRIIVTDFNNHRLVVIESNCQQARFLGSEGTGAKQFLRPQGVVVDHDGHIVVADSRNNRIQVFEPNGNFLWQFGSSGKEPGQLDRPSGVCLTPDGKIAVIDFGNNRVQMF